MLSVTTGQVISRICQAAPAVSDALTPHLRRLEFLIKNVCGRLWGEHHAQRAWLRV